MIFKVFFRHSENGDIYVCDSIDDRQKARKRKFDTGFSSLKEGDILKEDGIAVMEGTIIFNALLVHTKNKRMPDLLLAFRDLNSQASMK